MNNYLYEFHEFFFHYFDYFDLSHSLKVCNSGFDLLVICICVKLSQLSLTVRL